jgi:hypothetical protein
VPWFGRSQRDKTKQNKTNDIASQIDLNPYPLFYVVAHKVAQTGDETQNWGPKIKMGGLPLLTGLLVPMSCGT